MVSGQVVLIAAGAVLIWWGSTEIWKGAKWTGHKIAVPFHRQQKKAQQPVDQGVPNAK